MVLFLFVYSPEPILRGEPLAIALAAVTAIVGAFLLAVALSGYLFEPLGWLRHGLLVVAALGLLTPESGSGPLFSWGFELLGAALALAVLAPSWYRTQARAREARPAAG